MFKKLIGDKAFYKKVMLIAIPIMVQNGITNFVNMLDNIMVGRLGTADMTGVAVANQLLFVFNLCLFGAISGAGIFGSQFYGSKNDKGMRDTFRFKLIFCTALTSVCIGAFYFFGDSLIMLYLRGEGSVENAQNALASARQYLNIMLVGLLPSTFAQCYASSLRETGKTIPPMVAGIVAVCVNLVLNYVLIFGHLGFAPMGVRGAAIATVISRFVELSIVVIWTHKNAAKVRFIIGAYRSLHVPYVLVKQIAIKGLPLVVNEALWASGVAVVNQCYSTLGLDVVAANNINQTFFNVFSVSFMAVGVAIGIIIGQLLGANEQTKAMDTAVKLIAFSVFVSLAVSALFAICALFIPLLYNTTDSVRKTATGLMIICACSMPLDAFAHASYFTLRSGGKTLITFVFDSGFMWVASVTCAFLLTRFTSLSILYVYAIVQSLYILKCLIGFIFVKNKGWIRNITV